MHPCGEDLGDEPFADAPVFGEAYVLPSFGILAGLQPTGGGKQGILVRRADGVERTSDQLSTGTREQLYLAIRLAYVLHYCKQNQPLPIVIDDVLANFDDVRTRQTLTALADISQSTQVLFFTCHPHMVALAREVVPGLNPLEVPAIPGK